MAQLFIINLYYVVIETMNVFKGTMCIITYLKIIIVFSAIKI